ARRRATDPWRDSDRRIQRLLLAPDPGREPSLGELMRASARPRMDDARGVLDHLERHRATRRTREESRCLSRPRLRATSMQPARWSAPPTASTTPIGTAAATALRS